MTIGKEHVIISFFCTRGLHIFNVWPFTGSPVSACNMNAHIRIRLYGAIVRFRFILHRIITQPRLFIQFQHIYAAEPGTIYHPQISFFIIERAGINCICAVFGVPLSAAVEIPAKIRMTAEDFFHVCVCIMVCPIGRIGFKPGVYDGIGILIRAIDVVSRAKYD